MRTRDVVSLFSPILIAGALSGAAQADSATTTTVPFGMGVSLSASSSLLESSNPDYSSSGTLMLMPSYRLTEQFKLGARLGVDHELTGERNTALQNGIVSLKHRGFDLNPFLNVSNALGFQLPLNRDSRDRDSLVTGAKPSARLTFDFTRLSLPDLALFYDLSFSRLFHEYTTSTTGKSNIQYSLSNLVNLGYTFFGRITMSASFLRSTGWTYRGNLTNSFDFNQDLSWDITEAFSASIGHNNSGSALKPNGQDSNIALFDENSSSAYASLTYTF